MLRVAVALSLLCMRKFTPTVTFEPAKPFIPSPALAQQSSISLDCTPNMFPSTASDYLFDSTQTDSVEFESNYPCNPAPPRDEGKLPIILILSIAVPTAAVLVLLLLVITTVGGSSCSALAPCATYFCSSL